MCIVFIFFVLVVEVFIKEYVIWKFCICGWVVEVNYINMKVVFFFNFINCDNFNV